MGRALDLSPRDERFRLSLARAKASLAYQRQTAGRTEEAVRLYKEALAVDDREAVCWFNLGLAYQELGRTEQAREAYRRACALDPADPRYRAALKSLTQPAEPPRDRQAAPDQ